jgi:YgiT-type zinc finger domain-containing protein
VRCTVRGGTLISTRTALPFKVRDTSIVILKDLPVLECGRCPEYLLEDAVMVRVDQILARVDTATELTIAQFLQPTHAGDEGPILMS